MIWVNTLRILTLVEHVARLGENGNARWGLEGKPGGKRPLVRTRRRSVDNIKVGLTGKGGQGVNSSSSGWEHQSGFSEHDTDTSASAQGGKFVLTG